ncbi:MAG TPA: NUDIX domain-containing protein [Patescibacteria group bacterium]|jgi:ADP-ribose pyrophosphatase YjhB (NUDIX family)|nr:NUDIX domain-containing protein [Patescibacteria group bacterium]
MKIVAVGYVYIRRRKLLLVRSKQKQAFYLPGGKPQSGENDIQTLTRELREELSVEVIGSSIQPVGIFQAEAYGEPPGTEVMLRCFSGVHTGRMRPSSEIEEIGFFSYSDYRMMPATAPAVLLLFDALRKKGLTL